ncbi:MAG: LysR family transcriptional regulator [Myxococcota bacterium]
MDHLESLAFFVRIVEKRGIAAAGHEFGFSPATATERLAALEAHYDARLLHRTTRSLSLTEEGRVLLDGARRLIDDARDLDARIRLGIERLSGPIRLSAPHDLGMHRVAPAIDEFLAQHPEVHVDLILSDGYVDLVALGIDLAVRFGALPDSGLRARKLGDNRRIVCASPAYLECHGTPQHPDELAAHNCLVMTFGGRVDRHWPFVIRGRRRRVEVSGNRSASSGALVRRWCLDGLGIALKSEWDIRQQLDRGTLVELLEQFAPRSDAALQVIYAGGVAPSRRVRALLEHLVVAFDAP